MSAILDHNQTLQRNVICCLLALEIADYYAKPVFDQIRSTQDFQNLLSDATAHLDPGDLVSIVREDGALLSFLADPQECFATALAIRERTSTQDGSHGLSLRIGINLGRVQIAEDEFGHPHVSGEGTQDADRVMRQGPPQQISISRSFYDPLLRVAPELSGLLEYQGVFSDTLGPPLCLYRLPSTQSAEPERLSDGPSAQVPLGGVSVPPARTALVIDAQTPFNGRRHLPWLRAGVLTLLVGALVLTLLSRSRIENPVATTKGPPPAIASQSAEPAAAAPSFELEDAAPMPRPEVEPRAGLAAPPDAPLRVATSRRETRIAAIGPVRIGQQDGPVTSKPVGALDEPEAPVVGSAEDPVAQNSRIDADHVAEPRWIHPRNASLLLAVKPWGEVFVDGKSFGITPPLKRFEVPSGRHQITVTNSSLPSYRLELELGPEEQVTVAHDFDCTSVRDKPCREDLGRGLVFTSRLGLETPPGRR